MKEPSPEKFVIHIGVPATVFLQVCSYLAPREMAKEVDQVFLRKQNLVAPVAGQQDTRATLMDGTEQGLQIGPNLIYQGILDLPHLIFGAIKKSHGYEWEPFDRDAV
jgi:hypothetical protein